MLSPRRSAQLGVLLAAVVLASCLSVLLARGNPTAIGLVGQTASPIELRDIDGKIASLEQYRGQVLVLWFHSIRCPVTSQYAERVAKLSDELSKHPGVRMIGIHAGSYNSTDTIEVQMHVMGIQCPIWLDTEGRIAAAYGVSHTPSFVVIDTDGLIRYQGAQDDDVTGSTVTQHYVWQAVNALLTGEPITTQLTQAPGCPIGVRE